MKPHPKIAQLFIESMALGGLVSLIYGLLHMHPFHHAPFASLLVLAMLAARLKLKLRRLHGNMSVNTPIIRIAIVAPSLFEALMVPLASTVA
jgi:hypothetical protein